MRTKTMILSAACGLLGSLAAQADSVYSVNVVGYVNKTVPANTWTILVNPLNNEAGNALTNLFTGLTAADAGAANIFLWDATANSFINYYYSGVADGWANADTDEPVNGATLAPGQGFWFKNSSRSTAITFVGDVPTGSASTSLVAGWNLIASSFPVSTDLVSQGLTPRQDDNIFRYTSAGWVNWYAPDISIGWQNADTDAVETPAVDVGEGFWYNAVKPFTWSQTFNVNQ